MSGQRWCDSSRCRPGFQRHHLIPLGIIKRAQFRQFLDALHGDAFILYRFARNGLQLPENERLAAALGHAMHRGPHPAYSEVVAARLEYIRQSTNLESKNDCLSSVDRIRTLQDALRRALTDRHGHRFWLNHRDPMRIFSDRPYLDDAISALFGGD